MTWEDALSHTDIATRLARKYRMFGREDMYQEAMIGMGVAPEFIGYGKIEPYLYTQARSHVIDYLRTIHGRHFDRGREVLLEVYNDLPHMEGGFEAVEIEDQLSRLEERQAFSLRGKLSGATGIEIGEALGISESRVSQLVAPVKGSLLPR